MNNIWVIPAGHIPLQSTGEEPAFTSRDQICILNRNDAPAMITIMIYYENESPAGPYEIELKEKCVRQIRFNDLVNPFPISLDRNFAAVVESNIPIVVQFTRMDTSQAMLAGFTTMAFAGDE